MVRVCERQAIGEDGAQVGIINALVAGGDHRQPFLIRPLRQSARGRARKVGLRVAELRQQRRKRAPAALAPVG